MTYEETARFLNGALNYWPTLFRGNDPEAMTQAWRWRWLRSPMQPVPAVL